MALLQQRCASGSTVQSIPVCSFRSHKSARHRQHPRAHLRQAHDTQRTATQLYPQPTQRRKPNAIGTGSGSALHAFAPASSFNSATIASPGTDRASRGGGLLGAIVRFLENGIGRIIEGQLRKDSERAARRAYSLAKSALEDSCRVREALGGSVNVVTAYSRVSTNIGISVADSTYDTFRMIKLSSMFVKGRHGTAEAVVLQQEDAEGSQLSIKLRLPGGSVIHNIL